MSNPDPSDVVERLRALLNDTADEASYRILALEGIVAGLEANLAHKDATVLSLREALKPFAEQAHLYDGCDDDECAEDLDMGLTVGDLRRALSAYRGKP